MNLEVINVSNGTNDYPGNFTKEELRIIKYNSKGKVLNLFSGASKFGNVRVDYSHKNATIRSDVFWFLERWDNIRFNTIIIDAPYNKRFADIYDKYQDKTWDLCEQFIIFANAKKTTKLWNHIYELNPDIIILKSWNYYIPKGYRLKKGYLCYPGGYRKSTLLLILKKIDNSKIL